MPSVAELSVKVTADTKGAESGLDSVDKKAKDTGDSLDKSGQKGEGAFGRIKAAAEDATGGVGHFLGNVASFAAADTIVSAASGAFSFLTSNISDMVSAGMQANQIDAQIAVGLKSTHDASGMTAESINQLADSITSQTGITNDAVKASESMLLTFTNIGKDTFPQATQAVADLATKMNNGAVPSAQQMEQASIQLGKALGNPLTGFSALQRVGVTFDAQQKEQIKNFMKVGDVAGAQGVILKEMNKEFGGSADAAGQANGGLAILTASLDDTKEKIGQALIPVLAQLTAALGPVMVGFSQFVSGALGGLTSFLTSTVIPTMQQWMPVVQMLLIGAQTLGNVFLSALKPALDQIGKSLDGAHGPGLNVTDVMHNITNVVQQLVPFVRQAGQIFGELAQWFVTSVLPAARQFAQFVVSNVLPALGQIAQFVITQVIPAVTSLVGWFVAQVLPILKALVQIVITDVVPALENIFQTVMQHLVPAIQALWDRIAPLLVPILQVLGTILKDVIGPAFNFVIDVVSVLIDIIAGVVNIVEKVIGVIVFLAGIVGDVFLKAFQMAGAWIEQHFKPQLDAIGGAFQTVVGWVQTLVQWIDNLAGKIGSVFSGIGNLGKTLHIPGFAEGTEDAPGGMAIVGESGPELVDLPAHAQVKPLTRGGSVRTLGTSLYGAGGAGVLGAAGVGAGTGAQMVQVTSVINLDGYKVAQVVTKHQPSVIRNATGVRGF